MLTTCPAAALACSHVHSASAAAAPDTVFHDPARNVKPVGTPRCKIACTIVHAEGKITRSSRADCMARSKILHGPALCAGPRATLSRQLTPFAVHATAADGVVTAPGAAVCRSRSPDTAGSRASSANAGPHAGTFHCNSEIANAPARTAVHSPSADNAGADDDDSPLAVDRCAKENDVGPRELLLPLCKSRSEALTSLRGVFLPLVYVACQFTRCDVTIPRSTSRAVARAKARFVTLSMCC